VNTCDQFANLRDNLISWSANFLVKCQKAPKPVKEVKPGKPTKAPKPVKYLKDASASIDKKFKRVYAAYEGGANNQGGDKKNPVSIC